MSNLRPDWDFQFANGPETGTRTGSSPGCENQNGDGGFGGPTTGCTKQCPGCGGDWCCDCTGCKPGRCDEDPANTWCQDYYETWGKVAAGCPPPNNDPCYKIDPITQRWVANTDACFCPGATRVNGHVCNPDTGDWDGPVTFGDPSEGEDDDEDPTDGGPKSNNPNNPTTVVCYLKSVEVFGDYAWHQVPCHCRSLGTPQAIRDCIYGKKNQPGQVGCNCVTREEKGVITAWCEKWIDGTSSGEECDSVECNCNNDCAPGDICNEWGECDTPAP